MIGEEATGETHPAAGTEPGAKAGRAPDVVAPPPRHPRFPQVDGLRAIAALTVLVVHVAVFAPLAPSPGRVFLHLNVGVTIFFLISGFVLYRPFIAHRTADAPAPGIPIYAWRRFLRIFPAYWLVLVAIALLPDVEAGGFSEIAMLHTLPAFGEPACVQELRSCGVAQTWSLVVELTFYAALPLYAIAANRLFERMPRGRWIRWEAATIAGLAALSVVLHFGITDGGPLSWVGGTVAGYMLWFGIGMLAALVSVATVGREPARPLRSIARRPGSLWVAALGAYLILAWWLPLTPFVTERWHQIGVHLGFAVVAALIFLPAIFAAPERGITGRTLMHPVLAWLGLISYGLFLWHYPVVLLLGSPGAGLDFVPLLASTLAITIACASISYYVVERPILRLKYRDRTRRALGPSEPAQPR